MSFSIGYQQIRRIVEVARVRNDDAVACGETVEGFDFANRGGTQLYGSAHGLIAVNRRAGGHTGSRTPEALYDELAPLDT